MASERRPDEPDDEPDEDGDDEQDGDVGGGHDAASIFVEAM